MSKVEVHSGATFKLFPGVDDYAHGRADVSITIDTASDVSIDQQLKDGLETAEQARKAVVAALSNQILATLEELGGEIPTDSDGSVAKPTTVAEILAVAAGDREFEGDTVLS